MAQSLKFEDISPWIGVDLDGTLAQYGEWEGPTKIGPPIPAMVERVKAWLANGDAVKIFTARVNPSSPGAATSLVRRRLETTYMKDMGMTELWDDRAHHVTPNTGEEA